MEPTPLATLHTDGDRLVARYERALPHPPEKVWRALTTSEHLHHWMPCDIVGERRAGAPIELPFWPEVVEEHAIEDPVLHGTITAWEPTTLFEWTWDGDRLRFELAPDGEGTQLTFSVWLSDAERYADAAAGFHTCLDALARDLAGDPILHRVHDLELEARYRAVLPAGSS